MFPDPKAQFKNPKQNHCERKEIVMAHYKIQVKTGDMKFAGTDADVCIELQGTKARTPALNLDNEKNNFEQSNWDDFHVDSVDIGDLIGIKVYHNNSGSHPGWFLEHINVEANGVYHQFHI